MFDVLPGTLVIYGDIACPWATLAVVRLWDARTRLGLGDSVRFDLRAFPLELANSRCTPRRAVDAEIPVVAPHAPGFGWQVWQGRADEYAVSTLLALEAVQAAKQSGLEASERLDLALRRAFFTQSRCITLRHEILAVADDSAGLASALDDGRARRLVIDQWEEAQRHGVRGSPHVFTPDGLAVFNPAVSMHHDGHIPVIDALDPSAYDDLLRRAAAGR
jgi:predicted DsbA family dithiol-disulfide isomerase